MTFESILNQFTAILVSEHHVAETDVKQNTNIGDDLKLDSLDRVELVMSVENNFDISITDAEAEVLLTVGDWVDRIYKNCEQQH